MPVATFSLAIDVGGTFTDVVLLERGSGALHFAKVLSTPDDPSRGSLVGAGEILVRTGTKPKDVSEVIHATTVATNAVLERQGAKTGLLTRVTALSGYAQRANGAKVVFSIIANGYRGSADSAMDALDRFVAALVE